VIAAIHQLMERETAGDPISGLKWTRKTTAKIARQLRRLGISVSRNTVGRLLRQMKYSLRTNRKQISAGSTSDRDRQFRYLCRQRDRFEQRGDPILSVDAKKRELIGNFKNPGAKWEPSSTEVNDHDFRSAAKGIGIPYGVYDTQANRGRVFLGTSHETSAFAVSCLRNWWHTEGRKRYPHSRHILILADTGGSNGARRGAWKQEIQRQLCDGLGLSVTVSHYPSGASKWNPIEHRLFSQISRNWAAAPLDSYEKALKFIRTTTTTTGLKVTALLDPTFYPTGVKVSKQELAQLSIRQKRVLPKWNYTISPQM
jgi:Rhodopirellula transposase DDE domain